MKHNLICLLCDKPLIKGQTQFCCHNHALQYQSQQRIKNQLDGKDEGQSGTGIKKFIRKYLLEKSNYKCEKCGQGERNPYSGNIPLEIHHIDGNYKHNTLDNLQVLCPNCHSLTDTYKSLNSDSVRERGQYIGRKSVCSKCGVKITYGAVKCKQCELKSRAIPINEMPVTREELKKLIRITPFTKIASQYGVTDNAVRKQCDKLNLPRKVSDIKAYSEEDQELI